MGPSYEIAIAPSCAVAPPSNVTEEWDVSDSGDASPNNSPTNCAVCVRGDIVNVFVAITVPETSLRDAETFAGTGLAFAMANATSVGDCGFWIRGMTNFDIVGLAGTLTRVVNLPAASRISNSVVIETLPVASTAPQLLFNPTGSDGDAVITRMPPAGIEVSAR